jgi:hypothetical protein
MGARRLMAAGVVVLLAGSILPGALFDCGGGSEACTGSEVYRIEAGATGGDGSQASP